MLKSLLLAAVVALCSESSIALPKDCIQEQNCKLPVCFCPTFKHPFFQDVKDIPQMVYFGFDDALHSQVGRFYSQLFAKSRRNPNGCPISMSLYVQDRWTSYAMDGVSAHWQALRATPHGEGDFRWKSQSLPIIPMRQRGPEVDGSVYNVIRMLCQCSGNPFVLNHINWALCRKAIPLSMPQSPHMIPRRWRGPEVHSYYQRGMEIGSHSVTHTDIDTEQELVFEASKQKDNLTRVGHVPRDQIIGWRSPNLKTAGDVQADVLRRYGYTYDISLTYTRRSIRDDIPWPYTLDYGYPYGCSIRPCPKANSPHPGFWEIPVYSLYNPETGYPCAYVDSCRPSDEKAAVEYLWSNFQKVYQSNRAPFGLNMHAAWFYTPAYLKATHTFIERLLQLDDVYIVTAKQVLDWMRNPVKITEISKLPQWGCAEQTSPNSNTDTSATHHNSYGSASHQKPVNNAGRKTQAPRPFHHVSVATPQSYFNHFWHTESSAVRPVDRTTRPPRVTVRPHPSSKTPQLPYFIFQTPMSFIPHPHDSSTGRHEQRPSGQQSRPQTNLQQPPQSGRNPSRPSPVLITLNRHPINSGHLHSNIPNTNNIRNNYNILNANNNVNKLSDSNRIGFSNNNNNIDKNTNNSPQQGRNWWRQEGNSSSHSGVSSSTNVSLRGQQNSASVYGTGCVQGVTCKLPSCACRSLHPPPAASSRLTMTNTPQIVYLTFTGRIDGLNYQRVLHLLASSVRKNPNNCPISATFFLPSAGNYVPYVQSLRSRGNEISMYGSDPSMFSAVLPVEKQMRRELDGFKGLDNDSGLGFHAGSVKLGYRSPSGNSLGEDMLKGLHSGDVLYDSSLMTSRHARLSDVIPWPYTLDYGWKECGRECSLGRHPGLWEIPIVPLVDRKQNTVCNYADSCHSRPSTSQDIYNYFLQNLHRVMSTNRAPLGINLRREWFSDPRYYPNVQGLEMFLDAILTSRRDVYVTSIEKMLDWMRNPRGLDRINSFEPWKC